MDNGDPIMKNTPKIRYRIAVELYEIRNRNVGLGEFAHQLGAHLAARAAELEREHGIRFYFIVPRGYKGIFGNDVRYFEVPYAIRKLVRYLPLGMDICHLTHQFSRIKYMLFARHNLLTVHDINFIYEKTGYKLEHYTKRFRRRLSRVDRLSYITRFVREDVARHFAPKLPGRIVYNGVTDLSKQYPVKADLGRFGLPDDYLLHISSLMPKKNPDLLVEMMASLPEERLVIVGNWNREYGQRILARIAALGLTNITTLDHVSDAEKAALYAGCRGFLFPSQCEGFGLPPLEAMYFGKPVFLSTLTSLPEVGGPAACYYDSLDPEAMAEVTRRGLGAFYADATRSAEAVRNWARRFDWAKCADEYIAYYLDILQGAR